MKKNKLFFLFIIFVCCGVCLTPNYIFASTTPTQIQIVADSAKIYESPDITSTSTKTAYFYEKYQVEDISGNFYKIIFDTDKVGYVLSAYCMDTNNQPLTKYLDTNAVITKNSKVFLNNGTNYEEVENLILNSGTRVKLLSGSNNSNIYSFITFTQDNQNLSYYVLSENINADGVPVRTLVAIMLITTCVALFLIIYSFYKKLNKKILKNK